MTPKQIAGLISEDVSFCAGIIPEAISGYHGLEDVSITDTPWPILRDMMMDHDGDPKLFSDILNEFNQQIAQMLKDALNRFKQKYPDLSEDELYEYTGYAYAAMKTATDRHRYTPQNAQQLLRLKMRFYKMRAEATRELAATTTAIDADDFDALADALQSAADTIKGAMVNLVPEIN